MRGKEGHANIMFTYTIYSFRIILVPGYIRFCHYWI